MRRTTGTEQDIAEIRSLVDAYAIAMDRTDLEAFPRLFVADGVLIVRALGREKPMGVFAGPGADGVGLVATMLGQLYQSTLHHITTHQATIDGGLAEGFTYCLAYHVVAGDDGGVLETLGVKYEERFVRTDEGWRFHTRDATRLWSQITPTPLEPLLIDRAATRARNRTRPDQPPDAH